MSRDLRTALKRGIPVRFSSNEAATARFALTAGSVKLGSSRRLIGAGRSSIRIKLAHKPRSRVTVKMTLISAGGLSRTYSARVTLR